MEKTALGAFILAGLVLAAAGAAAASAAGRLRKTAGRLAAVGRRGENGKLNRVPRARALRARDFGVSVHHDALVVLAAIIANVFVDRHSDPILPKVVTPARFST